MTREQQALLARFLVGNMCLGWIHLPGDDVMSVAQFSDTN